MSEYGQMIARVKREIETEQRIRSLDAVDVVEEIHRLEDVVEAQDDEITTLRARVAELEDVLDPFSAFARELSARNWNSGDIVSALDNPDEPNRITAGDFFDAFNALQRGEQTDDEAFDAADPQSRLYENEAPDWSND